MIKRNAKGRYEKGSSGNLRGRPVQPVRENSPDVLRQEFFEVANTRVTFIEGGKRKTTTFSQAIIKRLAAAAVAGDRNAMLQWIRREEKYVGEELKATLDLLDQALQIEDTMRQFPDDVTDFQAEFVKRARAKIVGMVFRASMQR